MSDHKPSNLREYRARTDRNLLIGFFALLFIVGGGLILLIYGGGAAALGVSCMAVGAILAGGVTLVMLGIEKLSQWLDKEQ